MSLDMRDRCDYEWQPIFWYKYVMDERWQWDCQLAARGGLAEDAYGAARKKALHQVNVQPFLWGQSDWVQGVGLPSDTLLG